MNDEGNTTAASPGACLWASRRFRNGLIAAFWIWYVAAITTLIVLRGGLPLRRIWAYLLGPIWWILVIYRKPLQALSQKVRVPFTLKFFILGVFSWEVLAESFGINFRGDLHPNIVVSDFIWLGACLGVVLAWWLLAHVYEFTYWQVFFLYGFKGVLTEQDFKFPIALLRGDLLTFFTWAPYLLVIYAIGVAPIFLIMQRELPKTGKKPGLGGVFLGVILPMVLFYGVAGIWFSLVERLFGLKPGG
jgi:hypothetical protein